MMCAMDEVLAWVNWIRTEELGLEPIKALPKGWRTTALHCPVSLGLREGAPGASSSSGHISSWVRPDDNEPTQMFAHPDYVQLFIRRFDKGLFPELVR